MNHAELTKDAVIAPVHRPNAAVWMVTDYLERKTNDSERDEDEAKDESVVQHCIHYFIVAIDRTIQVHHHLQGDIVNDLDRIIDLLASKDDDIAGTDWWEKVPASETELCEWSRFRAVFFFSLVKRIVQNTAVLQTDNAQSRLLGETDVKEAIKDMEACWKQTGHTDKIGEERLGLLGVDAYALSEIDSAQALSHTIRELIVSKEGYPALEKCVMHCVCRLIDLVRQQTPVSG